MPCWSSALEVGANIFAGRRSAAVARGRLGNTSFQAQGVPAPRRASSSSSMGDDATQICLADCPALVAARAFDVKFQAESRVPLRM